MNDSDEPIREEANTTCYYHHSVLTCVLTFGNGLLRKTLPPMEWAQRKHDLFIQEVHRCPYFWKDGKPWILECGHVGNLGPWDFLNWSLLPSRCTLAATVQLCCVFFFWEFLTKYSAQNLDNFAPSKKMSSWHITRPQVESLRDQLTGKGDQLTGGHGRHGWWTLDTVAWLRSTRGGCVSLESE